MLVNTSDVLIVGAGPVGLFCANELLRHGINCRIIDKKSALSIHSKALGIHIRTLDVLEDCGFIEDVLKQGHPVEGVLFKSNGKTLVNATFADIEASRHFLIDLPQNQTEAILYKGLQEKGVQVEWDTELTHIIQTPHEVSATLKKPNNKIELYSAKWVIACDGSHSTLRHQVGAEFIGSEYKQAWWLADVHIDWKVPEERMVIYINDKGPLACFPMGNKRYRVVMTAPKGFEGDPGLADVEKEMSARSPDNAKLSDANWLSQFSIHHRQIQHYRHDRVFFAGDAAHIHSPMGGQGLNTGIQDVYNLAWKLALIEKNQANAEILDTYHAERYPVGHEVLDKTDKMTRVMLIKNPFLIKIRNAILHFITSFDSVKNFMAKDIAELSISYAKSPIVHQNGRAKWIKAGEYLPEFSLLDTKTHEALLSSKITQGTEHHLFLFSGLKNNSNIDALAESFAKKYSKTLKVHLVHSKNAKSNGALYSSYVDKDSALHKKLGFKKPSLILVRPDKYVGVVQNPINENSFREYLYLR